MDVNSALSMLLSYPDDDMKVKAEDAINRIIEQGGDGIAALISPFKGFIEGKPLSDLQESYTHTFDLNPACPLYVGYHLFGETYTRGTFLANLKEMENILLKEAGTELPDHLPTLLLLLNRIEDLEIKQSLIDECLIPSVKTMIGCLSESNVYSGLLKATNLFLEKMSHAVLLQ